MGLKTFLVQQGFIAEESRDKKTPSSNLTRASQSVSDVSPTYFPLNPSNATRGQSTSEQLPDDPSFVAPLQQKHGEREKPDPTFIKFFEDELLKANLPGADYFEFRQLLLKTQQKMAAKGVAAPEVILQAVLMSFEAQDITPAKIIETAKQYKSILKQKNDDFLKGASTEKNNQLEKRQSVLQDHDIKIKKIQQQLQQLEIEKQQLAESMNKEKTQMDVDKSLGQEAIGKIEKAEQLISLAHDYIQSTIDSDINRLQSL